MQTSTESPDSLDDLAETEAVADPKTPRWRWLRRLGLWVLIALLVVGAAALVILNLASVEPDFYQSAMTVDEKKTQQQRLDGNAMESKILNLHNSVVAADAWSVSFTDEQINGWLAWELERKFPTLIPHEVNHPRVKIADGLVTVAFRCDVPPFRGVGIIEAEIFLTDVLNQIGIRFHAVKSGMIPIPLALFTEQISEHAAEAGVDIEWLTEEGDPAVIIDLPEDVLRPAGNYVELKAVEIREDNIYIAGVTHLEDF